MTPQQPWLDLSLSQPSIYRNKHFDILNAPQLEGASRSYLRRFLSVKYHPNRRRPGLAAKEWRPSALEDLLSTRAFAELGFHHPLLSPAALDPGCSLDMLLPGGQIDCKLTGEMVGLLNAKVEPANHEVNKSRSGTKLVDALSPTSQLHPLHPFTGVTFLIHHGSAELFSDEAAYLSSHLRQSGIDVREVVQRGGVHVEPLLMGQRYLCDLVAGLLAES